MESRFLKNSIIVRDSVRKSEESTPKQHANFSFFGKRIKFVKYLASEFRKLSEAAIRHFFFLICAGNDSCVFHGLSEKATSD